MNEDELQEIAALLAHPSGEKGQAVAQMMNEGNSILTRHTLQVLGAIPGETVIEAGSANGILSLP